MSTFQRIFANGAAVNIENKYILQPPGDSIFFLSCSSNFSGTVVCMAVCKQDRTHKSPIKSKGPAHPKLWYGSAYDLQS